MSDTDDLIAIATKHGTDKWNGHWYAGPYAAHLGNLRDESFSLLEIGIGGYHEPKVGGHSLRAWKEFFPKATICGLDYFDKNALGEERIKIYQGSQADVTTIALIIKDHPDGFQVIIDDGSHRSEHVIASLLMLWPSIRNGGWYVIEDLQTSYWPNHGGRLFDFNSPLTSMGFLKSLVDGLNWQEMHQPSYSPSTFDKTIVGIHFYHNMCFLQKGQNTEGSTEVPANRINGVC